MTIARQVSLAGVSVIQWSGEGIHKGVYFTWKMLVASLKLFAQFVGQWCNVGIWETIYFLFIDTVCNMAHHTSSRKHSGNRYTRQIDVLSDVARQSVLSGCIQWDMSQSCSTRATCTLKWAVKRQVCANENEKRNVKFSSVNQIDLQTLTHGRHGQSKRLAIVMLAISETTCTCILND